jgi:flagellar basal body-associated protein FliL
MDCEKCGAELTEGAETCSDCGEPLTVETEASATPKKRTRTKPATDATPADDMGDVGVDAGTPDEPMPGEAPSGGGKRIAMIAVVVLLVVAAAIAGVLVVRSRVTAAASPEAAAKAMLTAYAAYDATGILDNATHASLATSDVAQFEKQATEAKTAAKNQPSVKNVVIGKVTLDTADKTKATVEVTAEWLDPATSTYAKRTESLIVVQQDGKWLVQLF